MKKDKVHIEIRNKIESLLKKGISIEKISKTFSIPLGTRYVRGSAKWFRYCIVARENQKKAIKKHSDLYSRAGKIAQQKHPWIGKELGKKYGKLTGKLRMEQIRKSGMMHEYFSNAAKILQKINSEHSKINMKKAHETMKRRGIFNEHQKLAALKCKEKNPNQLKEMSNKAHKLYPLGLLALESRRKNYPFEFMGCFFDSNEERVVCKKLVKEGLLNKPIEKENVHFRIGKCHIDFFIKSKIFLEFHPPVRYGRKRDETKESYYIKRRELLDKNGFRECPLVLISHIKEADEKIQEIKSMIHSH